MRDEFRYWLPFLTSLRFVFRTATHPRGKRPALLCAKQTERKPAWHSTEYPVGMSLPPLYWGCIMRQDLDRHWMNLSRSKSQPSQNPQI